MGDRKILKQVFSQIRICGPFFLNTLDKSFTLRSREAEIDTYQLGYVHGLTLCGWRGGSLERYAKRVGDAVFLALDAPDKRGGYKENHACQ